MMLRPPAECCPCHFGLVCCSPRMCFSYRDAGMSFGSCESQPISSSHGALASAVLTSFWAAYAESPSHPHAGGPTLSFISLCRRRCPARQEGSFGSLAGRLGLGAALSEHHSLSSPRTLVLCLLQLLPLSVAMCGFRHFTAFVPWGLQDRVPLHGLFVHILLYLAAGRR